MMGPAVVTPSGRWSSTTVSLGACARRQRDCHWDVIAVLANKAAGDQFTAYLSRGAPTSSGGQGKGFPGMARLPVGAEEHDRVEVITANAGYNAR
jgi:hypothetical protein